MNNTNNEPDIPADLKKALKAEPSLMAIWNDLTPIARRDFLSLVESAKQPETRKRRIERTIANLSSGKRRPCCFPVVQMDLYKKLRYEPEAKKQWSALTPTEKRDFSDWIDSADDKVERKSRVEEAFALLIAGKRRPR